ncbi:hypothetical protein KGD82_27615 (plasmid) [Nocardiopsis eucommiae]|uniref:HTH crp-type domain-containing protein n=1 Tax=Nocardiopsis eucommiae TaxID=2831970 RepID=A0A975LDG4_9ACTN|nr:hypothetical protein KGD82_27615 [Nocardiopsis eucommiae]
MGRHARRAPTPTPDTVAEAPQVQPLRLGRGDQIVVQRRQPPAKYDFVGGAFQQVTRSLFTIVKNFELGRREILILLLLGLEQEHGTGRVTMTQKEMAEELEIHRTDVSNLLGNLREIGLVIQVKRGYTSFILACSSLGAATNRPRSWRRSRWMYRPSIR